MASWHAWHMPEMLNSLRESSSRKVVAVPVQVVQVAASMETLRSTPVRWVRKASISGLLSVGFMGISIAGKGRDATTNPENRRLRRSSNPGNRARSRYASCRCE